MYFLNYVQNCCEQIGKEKTTASSKPKKKS
jgi:hypothetical protein